jgi:hypothetical protein
MYDELRTAIALAMDVAEGHSRRPGAAHAEPPQSPILSFRITVAMYDALQAAFLETVELDRKLSHELAETKAENESLRRELALLKGGS